MSKVQGIDWAAVVIYVGAFAVFMGFAVAMYFGGEPMP